MAMFLGFGLGLRLGEICGVRLRDIQGGDLLVRRAKGGGTRSVPLSGSIGWEVRAYVEGHRAHLMEWARLQGRAAEDPGTLLVHVHRGEPRPYTPDGLGNSLRDRGASVGVRL
jgi:integrase